MCRVNKSYLKWLFILLIVITIAGVIIWIWVDAEIGLLITGLGVGGSSIPIIQHYRKPKNKPSTPLTPEDPYIREKMEAHNKQETQSLNHRIQETQTRLQQIEEELQRRQSNED